MDQEIGIPAHFLCPISLQLMRDPVTISTGITYDRSSIEKWLFSRKNPNFICPVTKQPLSNPDLIPNHTLRRLIQSWCTLNSSHGIERIPTPKPPIDKTEIVKILNDAKKNPNLQLQSLKRLRSVVLESERNRSFLESSVALNFLASLIKNDVVDETIMETAIEVIFNLKSSETLIKNLLNNEDYDIINSLVQVLSRVNYQSRAYSTMLLKSIFDVADPIHLISVKNQIFIEIVRVLKDQISRQASKSALKLLIELCPRGRNRIKAVESGTVSVLIEILLNSCERRVCELVLIVLDQLCGCAEGRAALLDHGAGLAIVSKKIFRVSHVASDRAVRILSSICRFSAANRVVQEMLQVGVVAKLCLVIQVESGLKIKKRSREILKLHSRVWRKSTCIPPHLLSSYPS